MSPGNKYLVTVIGAGIFALVLIALYAGFGSDAVAPDLPAEQGTLSSTLWSDFAWAAVIIGVIIFAGAVGIIALVGGEMKWR